MADLILASSSPRRRVLLAMVGVEADLRSPDIDEASVASDLHPTEAVVAVAVAKAETIAASVAEIGDHRPVLAADTIVVCNDEVLGKPVDDADAAEMLRRQSGQRILVISAVALHDGSGSAPVRTRSSISALDVEKLTAEQIAAYVATGAGRDKAGALEVQGAAKDFVHLVAGTRSNVYGLPLAETVELLRLVGIETKDVNL